MLSRSRGIALLVLAALGLVVAPARAAKSPPKLVTVIGGLPVTIEADEPRAPQRIAIRLHAGVRPGKLSLHVLLARDARNRSANLLHRFEAKIVPHANPVAIRIAVRNRPGDHVLRPGRYRLVLGLRAARRRQRLALTVVIPPVHLKVEPPLNVRDSVAVPVLKELPFVAGDRVGPAPRLVLDPASTRLTNIGIETVRQPQSGSIDFKLPKQTTSLSPGTALTLAPELEGLSPGTYKGSVEIRADQLAQPLTLRYTVRVTYNGWWIVLLVGGGFLAGQIVRRGLAAVIRWLRAVRTAYDYAAKLASEAAAAADREFADKLGEARSALLHELGLWPKRSESIDAALTRAKASWSNAVKRYESASTEQAARLEALVKQMPSDTGIEPVDAVIAAAREHAEQASKLLSGSDPGKAAGKIVAAERSLKSSLPKAASLWAEEAYALLDSAGEARSRDSSTLRDLVDGARSALAAMEAEGATAGQMLTAANNAIRPLRHVVRETRRDLEALASKALVPGAAPALEDAAREGLRRSLAELEAVVREARVGEAGSLGAMAQAIRALSGGLEPIEPPEPAATRLGGRGTTAAGVSASPPDRGAMPPGEARTAHEIPLPAAGAAPSVPAFWVNVASSVNLLALIFVFLVRLIVLTVLFSLIGWLAYHEHFVGTAQEMAGIFLWAFTTDLTIEGVTQLATQRSQAPPAAAGG